MELMCIHLMGVNKNAKYGLQCLPVTYLEACRYPDAEDADVDQRDNNCSYHTKASSSISVLENDSDAVDDDLGQQLNLEDPA